MIRIWRSMRMMMRAMRLSKRVSLSWLSKEDGWS